MRDNLQLLPLRLTLHGLRLHMGATQGANRGPMAWCLALLKRLPLIGKKMPLGNAQQDPSLPNSSPSRLRFPLAKWAIKLRRKLVLAALCWLLDRLNQRLSSRGIRPPSSRSSKK